jgi:hypothetical protein
VDGVFAAVVEVPVFVAADAAVLATGCLEDLAAEPVSGVSVLAGGEPTGTFPASGGPSGAGVFMAGGVCGAAPTWLGAAVAGVESDAATRGVALAALSATAERVGGARA